MEAKVRAANTRSGNQVARWSLRTRRASSRAFDSSRCGSSSGYAVSVVMSNRLVIQTSPHKKLFDRVEKLARVYDTTFGLELYASPMTDHLAVTENKDAGPSWWTVAEHQPMGCTPLCGATDGPAPHVPSVSLG